jgi:5-methylcytosine-specific restriction enzyme A
MPSKPLKPCKSFGCPNLTRERYCDKHADGLAKERSYYDRFIRDKESKAFYNSKDWDIARKRALSRDHRLCQHCLVHKRITHADMVDHIIPIKINWNLRVSINNLQSLCNACHRTKTEADKRKYGEKCRKK